MRARRKACDGKKVVLCGQEWKAVGRELHPILPVFLHLLHKLKTFLPRKSKFLLKMLKYILKRCIFALTLRFVSC